MILLLAVPAGFGGQPFDERVIPKIAELRAKYRGRVLLDGGMNPLTYRKVMAAGADEAGANSYIWQGDVRSRVELFV